MNLDNDYDNDGNNIVPCPICLNEHCASKEGGKCPEEDDFMKDLKSDKYMTQNERSHLQLDKILTLLEEVEKQTKTAKGLIIKASEEAGKENI